MPYSRITRSAYGADAIAYLLGSRKGHNGSEKRNLYIEGVNMLPHGSVSFDRQMQPFWDKMDVRHKIQVNRFVVSFHPEELDPDNEVDQLTALEIGCRLAKETAPDCQSAVFVQSDGRGHKLHLHILTNDIRMSDGRGIDTLAYYHPHFRVLVDKVCKDYFDLVAPGPGREKATQAERGRREQNRRIAEANEAEMEAAEREGREPVLEEEKYIWKDDLRRRIKSAAAMAVDENSFAQLLRLDGVELLEQKQKDGSMTYVRHATKKMLEHYKYELFDVGGFGMREKIPDNLHARSCALGTDYGPESIRKRFRDNPLEIEEPEVEVDVAAIIAAARQASDEKDAVELARAKAMGKKYVSAILKEAVPDATEEDEDAFFDEFLMWRVGKQVLTRERGIKIPPVFRKDADGCGHIDQEQLDIQYRSYLHWIRRDEEDDRLWRAAEKKEKKELARAMVLARDFVLKLLKKIMPDADRALGEQLFGEFMIWRGKTKPWKAGDWTMPPVIRKNGNGQMGIDREQLAVQYRIFFDRVKRGETDRLLMVEEKEKIDRVVTNCKVKDYVAGILKKEMPDAEPGLADELFKRFSSWRRTKQLEAKENGSKLLPPVVTKDGDGRGRIVPEQLDIQYRMFLDQGRQDESEKKLREKLRQREELAEDIRQTAEEAEEEKARQRDVPEGIRQTAKDAGKKKPPRPGDRDYGDE